MITIIIIIIITTMGILNTTIITIITDISEGESLSRRRPTATGPTATLNAASRSPRGENE